MTIKQYEDIKYAITNETPESSGIFKWELLKALWDLIRAVKGGLDD